MLKAKFQFDKKSSLGHFQNAESYWRDVLVDSEFAPFPPLPSSVYQPAVSDVLHHELSLIPRELSAVNTTLIRAAWALVAGRMSNSDDVVFGHVASRHTFSTAPNSPAKSSSELNNKIFPFRVTWSNQWSVFRYLDAVNQRGKDVAPFEATGLQQIASICPEAQEACLFQTVLEIDVNPAERPENDEDPPRHENKINNIALHLYMKIQLNAIEIEASYDRRVIETWMVQKLLNQFELVLRQLSEASLDVLVADIEMVTKYDLTTIWERNRHLPPPIQQCIHKLFEEKAQACPGAIALHAWDGDMTYGELDRLSTMLAWRLVDSGVRAEVIVPVCFEKSMWTMVALLGVLKAGGAFVLLDPSLPAQRLATIIEKTKSKIVISSNTCFDIIAQFSERTIIVGQDFFQDLSDHSGRKLDEHSPENLMFVVFTSGSTGTPKGAMLTHQNLASAMFYEADHYKLDCTSRIYDFSSYGFIVSILNMFNAVCSGACICVPREEDRRNRLAESITSLGANIVHLTPSTAKVLSPDEVPGIKTVVFSGEGLHADDIKRWWGKARVLNVYGQSECAPRALINDTATTPAEATRLGRGFGQKTWVVDPRDHNNLVPIGCIGELLLEGPQVGRGYFADPEKTAASFIETPAWLLNGPPGGTGRSGRLFKTGDLVRSDPYGMITLIGRKDAQVKIRGQRVELGEVEHRISECLPEADQVVAEVIVPKGDGASPTLAVYLLLDKTATSDQSDERDSLEVAKIYHINATAQKKINDSLPSYMIPSVFFSLSEIPRTATNKINRRQLREIGGSYTIQELAEMRTAAGGPKQKPKKPMEIQVHSLWSQILKLDPSSIGLGDSFIQLGGDSIAAMKVVSEGRRVGIELSVASILSRPTLEEVADESLYIEQDAFETIEPFSLVPSGESLVKEAARLCGIEQSAVLDIYPCTPLQEGLFTLALRSKGDYVSQHILEISDDVQLELLCEAWEKVFESLAILRTRIITHQNDTLLQVVLDEKIRWVQATGLDSYLIADRELPMGIGQPLSRYALIKDDSGSIKWITWTLHHALYDGWSFPLLLRMVNEVYNGATLGHSPPFNRFIKYILERDEIASNDYWRETLMGYDNAPFPTLPPSIQQPLTDTTIQHRVNLTEQQNSINITTSTLIRAAWGLVMGHSTNTDDVVFGMPVFGRTAPVFGIDSMAGPTLATVPVRLKWKGNWKLNEYLERVHRQMIDMMPFEQTGLQRIAKSGPDSDQACAFQTMLLIQPDIKALENNSLGKWTAIRDEDNTYGLMLEIFMVAGGFTTSASFDSRIINPWIVRMLLERLEHVSKQLRSAEPGSLVGDIEIMTKNDTDTIWGWNHDLPEPVNDLIHNMIQNHALTSPKTLAICAWDGELTYGELDQLSTKLAWRLVAEGIVPDQIVPLCFEKSMWTTVAMVGVLKAGGGFVLLDATLPEQRLSAIVNQVSPRVILTSETNLALATRLSSNVIKVDRGFLENCEEQPSRTLVNQSPESIMYVVFTSGSTGTPKGVLLSHRNFASAVRHQQKSYRVDSTSRVYDFSSYSFDVAVMNAMNTLACGGCLCVPSEQERKNSLSQSINSFRATMLDITPSLSRLLTPQEIPSVQMMILGGEALQKNHADIWRGKVKMLNSYGPSECTPNATLNEDTDTLEEALSIGKGVGQVTWIVDPEDHNTLVVPGCVGELMLEGPLVGRGYLNDPAKTAAAFVENPDFLTKGTSTYPGRPGRLYKTGDLVQYVENGSLIFVGRKDMQVKIRGQRVELGEVECRIYESMDMIEQVAAEVIIPKGNGARPTLAAFICLKDYITDNNDPLSTRIFEVEPEIQRKLHEILPIYMVPSVFFSMAELPMTPSLKINRKQIREIGASFTAQELAESRVTKKANKRRPETEEEKSIQQIWSQVLSIEQEVISVDDNFFQLGGDSIGAMKMVAEARNRGFEVSVADVFHNPILEQLASAVTYESTSTEAEIPPFALIEAIINPNTLVEAISATCNWDPSHIQDVYPSTPLQEGLLSLSSKQSGDYILQMTLELSEHTSIATFRSAWEKVFKEFEVLRTRIIQYGTLGSFQIVMDEEIEWIETSGLEKYQKFDRNKTMEPGQRLARYALVKDESGVVRWFTWTIHHALYDGWSLPLILDAVHQAYQEASFDSSTKYNRFIKYLNDTDTTEARRYWEHVLEDYDGAPFPLLKPPVMQPVLDETIKLSINLPRIGNSGATVAVRIRAAWALAVGRWTNSNDVVFGAAVSGRNAPVAGIEKMMAPTIATVPVRVKWSNGWKVSDFIHMINQQAVDMIPFEQTGLRLISKLGPGSQQACKFQTLLAVQPKEGSSDSNFLGNWHQTNYRWRGTYALELLAQLDEDSIKLEASFDSRLIKPWEMKRLLHHFMAALKQLSLADSSRKLSEVSTIAEEDLEKVWRWNQTVPEPAHQLVQRYIERCAAETPNAPAICSWDCEWTYAEVHQLSTHLAELLHKSGVATNIIIPVYMERSSWMIVALLSVLKAGGGFLLLDPSYPPSEIKGLLAKLNSPFILTSKRYRDAAVDLVDEVILVGPNLISGMLSQTCGEISLVDPQPEDIAYVTVSVGVEGALKSVSISHVNIASAIKHQSGLKIFDSSTRLYNTSTSISDFSVVEVLLALGLGGCVCVPSDQERLGGLAQSINSMQSNTLITSTSDITPINPDELQNMTTLIWRGEPPSVKDASPWWGRARLVNTYGPAECTSISLMNLDTSTTEDLVGMGKGVGQLAWVVDPADHNRLAPIGSIGELLLEGPSVGGFHLEALNQTGESFIQSPAWLLSGAPGRSGRHGYLFKTGDLVRYNEDGSLIFISRKDTGAKLHGQAVDLSEVERCVQRSVPKAKQVVAEIILTMGEGLRSVLAVFIPTNLSTPVQNNLTAEMISEKIQWIDSDVEEELGKVLPRHMVPTLFLSVESLPLTPSGQVDRKLLREVGGALSVKDLDEKRAVVQRPKRQPTTPMEKSIQRLWSEVLDVELDAIGLDDNFFHLGGDSIYAMSMASVARRHGIQLTVSDLFHYPKLKDVANRGSYLQSEVNDDVDPFSLLRDSMSEENLRDAAAHSFDIENNYIEDAYPCTPLQEGLLSLSSKNGDYVNKFVLKLSEDIDISRFRRSWEEMVQRTAILRTRIYADNNCGLLQVVVKEGIAWITASGLSEYLELDRREPMTMGKPLARYALIEESSGSGPIKWFVWTIHHALYDGWSMPLMIGLANRIYQGRKLQPTVSFNKFIQYYITQDSSSATDYWRKLLKGCNHTAFPALPSSVQEPAPDQVTSRHILLNKSKVSHITISTLVHAAWSLVVGRMIGEEDVIFGTTVSGRSASVAGIEEIVGPTIATVPIRVAWSASSTIEELLEGVQGQRTEMIPFEQTGLQRIANMNSDCARACNFKTLLIIQPHEREAQENVFGSWQDDEGKNTNTYPLTLFVELGVSEITIRASFDSRIIELWMMNGLLKQFEVVVKELHNNSSNSDKALQDLDSVPSSDLKLLWDWNSIVPGPIDKLVHSIIREQTQIMPAAQAIHAWDGDLTYDELDRLSTSVALCLADHGVASGMLIPLCFEKSKWAIVSLFGVLKAGGAFVLLDMSLPEQRLKSIIQQLDSNLILSSSAYRLFAKSLSGTVVVVDGNLPEEVNKTVTDSLIATPSSDSIAYAVFTSGSTGTPKGVQISHSNLVSAIHYQKSYFKYSESSRFLDFASYSFDMALFTIFHTFAAGACLCIPRDEDRKNNLPKAIASLQADTLVLTPSVSRSIRPMDVPGVKSVLWCGETLHSKDAEPWFERIHAVNTYGPSECTPVTVINYDAKTIEEMGYIGKGVGVVTWVVDPENYNHLVPIGNVGELLLEGPLVGLGYLKNPDKTSEVFVENPSWLVKGFETHSGRDGRLYRTGDLVRYTHDGNLIFVGRKHTNVKIRGQWVELSDVGYQVGQHLPTAKQVVAEVITPGGDEARPLLAAFLEIEDSSLDSEAVHSVSSLKVYHIDTRVQAILEDRLPKHLMPEVYFSIPKIPMTAAGKTNRGRLRELGASLTIQELAELRSASQGPKRLPQTAKEMQMQLIWSQVLQIKSDIIGLDDNFFQLGGDSIRAMMLVGAARKHGISLSIANVFRNPRLEQLAHLESLDTVSAKATAERLVGSTQRSELLAEIDRLDFELASSEVADIVPLTDFQFNLVQSSMSNPPLFCNYFYLDLDVTPDDVQLEKSCAWTLEQLPILRSRFLPLLGSFWQVIPRDVHVPLQVLDVGEDLHDYSHEFCSNDSRTIKVTNPPFSVLLFRGKANKSRLVIRLSHTQYDGISWVPIFTSVLEGQRHASPHPPPLFTDYLTYAHNHRVSSREYWTRLLRGSSITRILNHLPQIPVSSLPRKAIRLERDINMPQLPLGITIAALLSSAWAVLLFELTGDKDIIYSQLVAGRNSSIEGVENIVGPCINIVPVRASLSSLKSSIQLLHSIQDQYISLGEADSLGLRDIQEQCTEWPIDSAIDSVIVHQGIDESPTFQSNGVASQLQSFPNPHHIQSKIWVTSRPLGDRINIEFQANTHIMKESTANSILIRYCEIATSLSLDHHSSLELSSESLKLEKRE